MRSRGRQSLKPGNLRSVLDSGIEENWLSHSDKFSTDREACELPGAFPQKCHSVWPVGNFLPKFAQSTFG